MDRKELEEIDVTDINQDVDFERIIDYQIEQTRHYENRAERILRIFIASVGISFTGLSIFLSTANFNITNVSKYNIYTRNSIERLGENLSAIIGGPGAGVVILSIFLLGFGIIATALVYLTRGIKSAEIVLRPQGLRAVPPITGEGNSKEKYASVIRNNEEILKYKRENLESILKIIVTSVLLFVNASIILVVPFAFRNPQFTISIVLLSMGTMVLIGVYEFDKNDVLRYAKPRKSDILAPFTGFSALIIAGTTVDIESYFVSILMLLSVFLVSVYTLWKYDEIFLIDESARKFGIFMFGTVLTIFAVVYNGVNGTRLGLTITNMLTIIVFGFGIIGVIMFSTAISTDVMIRIENRFNIRENISRAIDWGQNLAE